MRVAEPALATSPPRAARAAPGIGTRPFRLLALVLVFLLIAFVVPRPASVSPQGWRITALFLSTILGLMIQPMAGAALVIVSLTLLVIVGGQPASRVLAGYGSPSVWLVFVAMLMSRALRDSGLSRRLALGFVRLVGRTPLGVSYALALTDVTLASSMSGTARGGGVVLPIARSLAELYDSHPGETASRLGRFLMMTVYQGTGISCAMFLTGQASNVLVAGLASRIAGTPITWSSWFVAALVPGLASYIAMPLVVRAVAPPDLVRTPEAAGFARAELAGMGPMGARERMTAVVFGVVCLLWMTTTWHGIEVTVVALLGLGALLLTNAITWEQCLGERAAWDIFVWYGGLLTMGEMLNESGTPAAFAAWVGGWFGGTHWLPIMFVIVGIYFYAHYAFASLTAHALAMFQPFALVLIGLGAPALPTVYALACIVNLSAGLTHYGTTTGPMVFAEGYVTLPDWWKVGFVVSLANLAFWLTVGFLWWKLLGFW